MVQGKSIDITVKILTGFCFLIIAAIIIVVMSNIITGGWAQLSWEFIFQPPRKGMTAGGIFPAIFGTFALVLIMTIFVLPIGIITAIFMNEYSSGFPRLSGVIRVAVNNLSGVPSIVFGLFGLGFFVQFVGWGADWILGHEMKWSQPCLLWASMTMALLTLPVVIVSTEEALRSIPKEHREGSLALGSTKWQMIRHIVIPQALPGILTGAILSVSRGAGEVTPILFTGAAYFLPRLPSSLSDQFMELGYHIYIMSTQSVDVDATLPIQYATTLILLLLTFTLNFSAIFLRAHIRRKRGALK
ncbi:MAG: phosphate ABC transporter permease PstA [Acidobacteriota bacterium]